MGTSSMCPRASRLCWSTCRWVPQLCCCWGAFMSPLTQTHPGCVLLCAPQTDLVDQNLLNFLPIGEHSDVYKALSTHPSDPESLNSDFMKSKLLISGWWSTCAVMSLQEVGNCPYLFQVSFCALHLSVDLEITTLTSEEPLLEPFVSFSRLQLRTIWSSAAICCEGPSTPKNHLSMNMFDSLAISSHSIMVRHSNDTARVQQGHLLWRGWPWSTEQYS